MALQPKARGLFSKLSNLFFGKPAEKSDDTVITVHDLMSLEDNGAQAQNCGQEGQKVGSNHSEVTVLTHFTDEETAALNELLPYFNHAERLRIIKEMQGDDVSRRIALLRAVADHGNTGLFASGLFQRLISGLKYSVKARERVLFVDQTRVRFGIMMHLASLQGAYTAPLETLYREDDDESRLILRDPSLDSALVRNPEHLNRFVDLLIKSQGMTGNRMASIIRAQDIEASAKRS